ncbi:copper amine oxidase N-terminal domain-containing protein [Paenibacillus sp. KQZ6P-2]|uniref:Copper amine oxidase N-terminal domain-containing protein n=1 Tax=Paenibacillus mangrovi TaxID=2931978 RepID=A0A9X1WUH3_9BACL|nr:copper amine oxidase N-terminal domain-containing protein [Paenibacillus mangrovi]MCJ8014906.1 copper amine oxidase N-terminal domain-containing protein [Paenibacillus mangrovi]
MKKSILILRITVIFTLFATSLVPLSLAHAEQKRVTGTVVLDGKALDDKATIINGNTMIPFRSFFEALGMSVNWDQKTKTVTASKNDLEIKMTNGILKAIINNKDIPLTQAPFLDETENKFYVNTRVVAESTGATVEWDNVKKIASITTKN